MILILTILLSLGIGTYFLLWLPTFLTLRPKYKYYKQTYLALKNKEYILSSNDESIITFKPKDKVIATTGKFGFNQWQFDYDEILYFKGNETIKLTNGYIHKNFMPFFDPYTQYWHKKIKNEILLNSRSIAQIREDKLNQLKIK